MRKRGMSLNRKKLKEKVKQLEETNKALVWGLPKESAGEGIAGAVQMGLMRVIHMNRTAFHYKKRSFQKAGVVPVVKALSLTIMKDAVVKQRTGGQRLRDKVKRDDQQGDIMTGFMCSPPQKAQAKS